MLHYMFSSGRGECKNTDTFHIILYQFNNNLTGHLIFSVINCCVYYRSPKVWKPRLTKRVFYSEILDKWFAINVTYTAIDQINECYGLDYYILKVVHI